MRDLQPEPYNDIMLIKIIKSEKVKVNLNRLALKTGFSASYLGRVIRGERNPSMKCAIALAKAMNMTVDELYNAIKEGSIKHGK